MQIEFKFKFLKRSSKIRTSFNIPRLLRLVHTTNTDKPRQSCLVRSVNRIGNKSKLLETEKFPNCFVQSRNAVSTEFCLVSTQFPICNRRQDWTKLFSLQYTEDYWKQSWLVANCDYITDMDRTRQDSLDLSKLNEVYGGKYSTVNRCPESSR